MLFGLIGVPLITGGPPILGPGGGLFVPFFFCLPIAFFMNARDRRQLNAEVRDLRSRVEELERGASGGGSTHG
jgi:hypothetical protein